MFDITTGQETMLAWNQGRTGPDDRLVGPPDLQLHLVHVASGALTVEVIGGTLDTASESLFVAGRGVFEITARLRRVVDGHERIYLRLRLETHGSDAA